MVHRCRAGVPNAAAIVLGRVGQNPLAVNQAATNPRVAIHRQRTRVGNAATVGRGVVVLHGGGSHCRVELGVDTASINGGVAGDLGVVDDQRCFVEDAAAVRLADVAVDGGVKHLCKAIVQDATTPIDRRVAREDGVTGRDTGDGVIIHVQPARVCNGAPFVSAVLAENEDPVMYKVPTFCRPRRLGLAWFC